MLKNDVEYHFTEITESSRRNFRNENSENKVVVVVVVGFYVLLTAKVIRRRDLGLKSHPKDWRSPGSNSRPLD